MAAWTRELRPLTEQLCGRIHDTRQRNAADHLPLSQQELFVRVNRVVGQLSSHLFVDCVPQDVQTQTRALATKFRIHSLEDRADKLLQLAEECDYQVLKLLMALAASPTTATDEEVAVDQDSQIEWNVVLQQERLRREKQEMAERQLCDELHEIATCDEWYQAWDNSEDESNDEMSSEDDCAAMDGMHTARTVQRSDTILQVDEEENDRMEHNVVASTSIDFVDSKVATDKREQLEALEDDETIQDEMLRRYYPEVTFQDGEIVADDPTCEMETIAPVPFTLERPWLLCGAVVKIASSGRSTQSKMSRQRLMHEKAAVNMVFEALHGVDSLLFEFFQEC